MITLKTVLKSGGEYKPEHVLRMQEMLDRYVDFPARFVCYSDMGIPGVTVRPLLHDWPTWFSKIEMFRDVEDSFYIDLDMTVQGNITDMVMVDSDFMALSNMNPRIGGIGSAMMKWRGDYTRMYNLFSDNSEHFIQRHSNKIGTPMHGDQGYIFSFACSPFEGFKIDCFQDKFPNRISDFRTSNQTDIKVYFGKRRPWK